MRTLPSVAALVMSVVIGHLGCRVAPEAPPAARGIPTSHDAGDDDNDSTSNTTTNGSTGGTTSGTSGTTAASTPASPSDSEGRTSSNGGAPSSAEPDPDAPAAGAAGDKEIPAVTGAPGASAGCDAQTVSFDEIRGGEVRSNVKVRVDATATSQKFLLSHAKSGSCLFAAFVGTAPVSDGPRGLLVVSYGKDAASSEPCAPGTDAIPDDLSLGDAVSADGYLSAYAPSGCASAPSPQLMVDAACPLTRSGRAEPPPPVTITTEQADAIARGTDAALLRRFAGGLVRLAGVSAARPDAGTGAVAEYGVVALNETALEIHNDLEYGDLSLGGPGDAAKSLVYPFPTTFSSVTGLVYLDYCTWSLAPRNRCTDLAPPSHNCP